MGRLESSSSVNYNQVPPAPPNHDAPTWWDDLEQQGAIPMRQSIEIESHCCRLQGCLTLCQWTKTIKLSENVEPPAEDGMRVQLGFGVAEAREVSELGLGATTL